MDFNRIMDYAEKHCWPNSQDDKTVKFIADKVSEFCSLVHLRDNFEAQIQKYGSVRYKLEHKVITIEKANSVLEAISTLDGALDGALTPLLAKSKHDFEDGFKLAVETARAFNSSCLWSMKVEPDP